MNRETWVITGPHRIFDDAVYDIEVLMRSLRISEEDAQWIIDNSDHATLPSGKQLLLGCQIKLGQLTVPPHGTDPV